MDSRHLSSSSLSRRSNFSAVRLQVEYVATSRLKGRSRQVRRRSKQHDKRIARSIDDFGCVVPIIVDEHLTIVAGEGRWEAAKLLGMTEVPVIKLEHLTEEQLRLFAIADNKLPEGARWDDGALLLELTEIEIAAPELELTSTGFEVAEIDTIYGRQRTNELSDFDDPVEPDRTRDAVSRIGDIWILGRHIVGCGDALDSEFIARLLNGRQVRLLLSDPPWNLEIPGVVSGNGKHKHENFVMASGEMSKGEFTAFLADAIRATEPHLVDGALVYLFMDWRNLDALSAAAHARNLEQKNLLVWCKDNAGLGSLYRSQHELIGLYKYGKAPHTNNILLGRHGRNRSNVLFYSGVNSFSKGREKALETHPTCKPVGLLADIILDVSGPGELVLDPFGGSGSTLIAAEKTDRIACLAELDPAYVDAIVARFEAATGIAGVHAETGRGFSDLAAQRQASSSDAGEAGHGE